MPIINRQVPSDIRGKIKKRRLVRGILEVAVWDPIMQDEVIPIRVLIELIRDRRPFELFDGESRGGNGGH